jgi:hypothetical protein
MLNCIYQPFSLLTKTFRFRLLNHVLFRSLKLVFFFRNQFYKYFYVFIDGHYLKIPPSPASERDLELNVTKCAFHFFSFSDYGKNEIFIHFASVANVRFKVTTVDHMPKPKTQWYMQSSKGHTGEPDSRQCRFNLFECLTKYR